MADITGLELSLAEVAVPEPGPDEVLVRIEAAPMLAAYAKRATGEKYLINPNRDVA